MTSIDKITLVDDDEISNTISKICINRYDKEVVIHEYQKASDFMKHIQCNNIPTNLLLDLNMPLVSGWDILDEIKAKKIEHLYNIIILSTSDLTLDTNRSKEYQSVVGYICKPLNPAKVKHIFSLITKKHQSHNIA